MASGNESGNSRHKHQDHRLHGVNGSTNSRFNSATHIEVGFDEDDRPLVEKVQLEPSYPSSSELARELSSHLNASMLNESTAHSNHAQPARIVDSGDNFSIRLEELGSGYAFPALSSQVPDLTNESLGFGVSPSQPPPVQGMERSGGYDPCRIPASVFETSKPCTPLEWSVASNESLFSIHGGNSSFNKDQIYNILSGDFHESGEFFMLGQQPTSTLPLPPAPPPLNLMDMETAINDEYEDLGAAKMTDDSFQTNFMETLGKQKEEKAPPLPFTLNSSSISGLSDGSGESSGSTQSFAFPVLAQQAEKEQSLLKPEKPPESEPKPELDLEPPQVIQQREKIELPPNFFKKDKWCACPCSFSCCSWFPRCYSGGCC